MLLMMAWMFWFFCGEEKKKDEEDIQSDGVNIIPNKSVPKDIILENITATQLSNSLAKNNEIVEEESIDRSFINLDESENFDGFPLDESENFDGFPIDERENFDDLPVDESENYDNFHLGDNTIPTTVVFDQDCYNFNFNDFDDENIDYEVSSAFMSANEEEEVMNAPLLQNRMTSLEAYQGKMGDVGSSTSMKLNVSTNSAVDAAGRIHSITIGKGEENHDTRIRSVSPMVCIHPEHSVHDGHKGYEGFTKEEIQPAAENHIIPTTIDVSNTAPGSDGYVFTSTEEHDNQASAVASNEVDIKLNPGKLNPGKLKKTKARDHVDVVSTSPSAKLTDFETVMKSRKLHTDTMDITANVLGNLGHRKQKLKGRKVSKNWAKLQEAVSKRQFLSFKDVPFSASSMD